MPLPRSHPGFARSSRHGFTLLELLTVIAIIGILAAVLFPAINAVRQSARATQDMTSMRTFGQAMMLYAADNKGRINQHGSTNSNDLGYETWPLNTFMGRAWPYLDTRNLSTAGLTTQQMKEVSNRYVCQMLLNDHPELIGSTSGFDNTLAFNKGLFTPNDPNNPRPARSEDRFRRVIEVARPASTVYAAVGTFGFNPGVNSSPKDLPVTLPSEAVYWPYSGKRTILVFMDGHTTFWGDVITASMSKIN